MRVLPVPHTQPDQLPNPRAVEAFARDLLSLIRNVRVYPTGHPFLLELCERLLVGVANDLPCPLDVGVANGELVVGGEFFGGAGTRAEYLARFLHGREVLRMVWSTGATAADAEALAGVLRRDGLQARQVCDALLECGVHAILLEPLTLERIHGAFRPAGPGHTPAAADGVARAREAWHWLLYEDAPLEQLAASLDGGTNWSLEEMDPSEAAALAGVLVRTERKLERALEGLAGERREQVLERLVEVGRRVPVTALAKTLVAADRGGGLHGPAVAALEQSIDEGRLVDLLAALVSDQGKNTRRLVDVYRRFAPAGGARDLMPVVQARMSSGQGERFSGEVWQTLEQFLFSLHEDPFMEQDYSLSLDRLAEQVHAPDVGEGDLIEDLQPHLDRVLLALATDDPDGGLDVVLQRRLVRRGAELGPLQGVRLLEAVDGQLPGFLDRHPQLVQEAMNRVCLGLREVSSEGRLEVIEFARRREAELLEFLLRRLLDEGRLAVRRFLVDLLSAQSPATTPAVVSRMRSGPWYLTRNLALVLGGRGDPAAVPALRGLLGHEHPKVRGAALTALGQVATPEAAAVLGSVTDDAGRPAAERAAAARALRGEGRAKEMPR